MQLIEQGCWVVREAIGASGIPLTVQTSDYGTIEDVKKELDVTGKDGVEYAICRRRFYSLFDDNGRYVTCGSSQPVVEYYKKNGGK